MNLHQEVLGSIGRSCKKCGTDDWIACPDRRSGATVIRCHTCRRNAERKRRQRLRQRKVAAKVRIFTRQGKRCACPGCEVSDLTIMDVAHLSGDGAEHRRRFLIAARGHAGPGPWHRALYLEDCERRDDVVLLCRNCNGPSPTYRCPHAGRSHGIVPMLDVLPIQRGASG